MQRVHGTFDLLEAHIVAEMLKSRDIPAWVFDANFVRQDWLKAIAYGGYRVVVADADKAAASEHVDAYLHGAYSLPHDESDHERCPRCQSSAIEENYRPRRWIFAFLLMDPLAVFALTSAKIGLDDWFVPALSAATIVSIALALAGPKLLRRKMYCNACRYSWYGTPTPWPILSRSVIQADGT